MAEGPKNDFFLRASTEGGKLWDVQNGPKEGRFLGGAGGMK